MPFIEIYDEANDRILTKQVKSYGRCKYCGEEFVACQEVYVYKNERFCEPYCIVKEMEYNKEISTEYVED